MGDDALGTSIPLRTAGTSKTMESDTSSLAHLEQDNAPSALKEKWVQDLLADAQRLQTRAVENSDVDACALIHSLVMALLQTRQLQNYFHRSPSRSIQGPGGVAEQLELTRNAVYKRLESLGLDVKEFRVPKPFKELIEQSTKIPGMIADVKQRLRSYERASKPR